MSEPLNLTTKIHLLLATTNTPQESATALQDLFTLCAGDYPQLRQAVTSQIHQTAAQKAHTTLGIFGVSATARVIAAVRSYPRPTRTKKLIEQLSEEKWEDLADKGKLSEVIQLKTLSQRRRSILRELIRVVEERIGRAKNGCKGASVLLMDMLVQEADLESSCEAMLRIDKRNRVLVLKWAQVLR